MIELIPLLRGHQIPWVVQLSLQVRGLVTQPQYGQGNIHHRVASVPGSGRGAEHVGYHLRELLARKSPLALSI